jgi:hypothetical protein
MAMVILYHSPEVKEDKMEYTKGKWMVDRHIVASSEGDAICAVYEHEDGVAEANAHLIAAAPDMYEALRTWDKLRAMQPLDSGADIDAILQKCAEITDKAILKAEGK